MTIYTYARGDIPDDTVALYDAELEQQVARLTGLNPRYRLSVAPMFTFRRDSSGMEPWEWTGDAYEFHGEDMDDPEATVR